MWSWRGEIRIREAGYKINQQWRKFKRGSDFTSLQKVGSHYKKLENNLEN